jgi:chromate transporter
MGGLAGAAKATAGIFLPSFLFVGFLNPLVSFLRKSGPMSAFLDAVNVAAIALILAVCIEMGKSSVTDWKTALILVAGIAVSLFNKKINSAFIILGGAAAGYLLWLI